MGKYTAIDDPSAYFQVKLWTGNAGTNAITLDGNSDMQPDFMWHKEQNDTNGWHQFDSSRGVTKYLATQSTGAEGTFGGYLTSFDSNGFTANYGDSSMNSNGTAQCSWMWHSNAGTTSSNTDGSITSTVQANQDAGFSIVTYTTAGSTATIGHGLGAKPDVILLKKRNGAISWYVRHVSTGTSYLNLNLTSAAVSNPAATWTTTEPTTSVYSIGTSTDFNISGGEYVAYCFAEKQGYSKFGKYTGNGSPNGPFIYTGFKPAFVMVKKSNNTGSWVINDSKRIGYNPNNYDLYANLGAAEEDNDRFDLLSNGFKARSTSSPSNASGDTYIYMAFAESPFVTSTGIMGTAR